MSNAIKILVVDQSVAIYRALRAGVRGQADLEIAACVSDAEQAMDALRNQLIDVIVLGAGSATSNTVELVKRLHGIDSSLPILLFAPDTLHGGTMALEALSAGASQRIGRPPHNTDGVLEQSIQAKLLPAVRRWYQTSRFRRTKDSSTTKLRVAKAVESIRRPESCPIPAAPRTGVPAVRSSGIIAIGGSTGGVQALKTLLSALPPSQERPVVIVQHILTKFSGLLTEQLGRYCRLSVCEATDGQELNLGGVYIAPGGRHLTLREMPDGRIRACLNDDPPVNSCRPAVDVLFASVAKIYTDHAVGVVLTGMGQDGTEGCRLIREVGGTVFVQDRESCAVWGMPRSVEEAGLASEVVPLDALGTRITRQASCV